MSNCLVLSGHPLAPSFSAALADSYADMMAGAGIAVRRVDLAGMDVPASIPDRLPGDDVMRGDVAKFWEDMLWADHVVIVHPLWWGGMPAKLKALFDLVLQNDKAYRYDGRMPLPQGLLKGRSARVIVTSDTPGWFMTLVYGNAHFRIIKNQILRFVGFGPIHTTHLSMIRESTPEKRAAMLEKVVGLARRDAARLGRKAKMAA